MDRRGGEFVWKPYGSKPSCLQASSSSASLLQRVKELQTAEGGKATVGNQNARRLPAGVRDCQVRQDLKRQRRVQDKQAADVSEPG